MEAAPLVDQVRHPVAQERAAEDVEVGGAPEQDGDLAARRSRREQCGNAPRHHLGLGLDAFARDVEQLGARALDTFSMSRERVVGGEIGQGRGEEQVGEIDQRGQ